MTPENLARARRWLTTALDGPGAIVPADVWLRMTPGMVDTCAEALAAAVRAKAEMYADYADRNEQAGLAAAYRQHAADVPDVPEVPS